MFSSLKTRTSKQNLFHLNTDIVILCPIPIEYEAVKKILLKSRIEQDPSSALTYVRASVKARQHTYDVVLRKTGSGHAKIMNAVHEVVHKFQPALILLVGTAGGIKKVKLGDLVIGNKAYNYEAGRERKEDFAARPEALMASKELIELADKVAQEGQWRSRLADAVHINYYIKPIASGDKVIETVDNYLLKRIRQHYDDALALEMEAAAFLEAASLYPQLKVLNIRAVSDLLSDKANANKAGSRERAASIAAAFALELINHVEIKKSKITPLVLRSATLAFVLALLYWFWLKPQQDLMPMLDAKQQTQLPTYSADDEKINTVATTAKPQKDEDEQIVVPKTIDNHENKVETPIPTQTAAEQPQATALEPSHEVLDSNTIITTKADTVVIDHSVGIKEPEIDPAAKAEEEVTQKKVKHSIYVYDKEGIGKKRMHLVYEIDGKESGQTPDHLELVPGLHTIKLWHKNKIYQTKISVPIHNNKTNRIILDELEPTDQN